MQWIENVLYTKFISKSSLPTLRTIIVLYTTCPWTEMVYNSTSISFEVLKYNILHSGCVNVSLILHSLLQWHKEYIYYITIITTKVCITLSCLVLIGITAVVVLDAGSIHIHRCDAGSMMNSRLLNHLGNTETPWQVYWQLTSRSVLITTLQAKQTAGTTQTSPPPYLSSLVESVHY